MELPENIQKTLENIRKGRKHYVDVKIINGRCYVYESTSKWDSESKKVKKTNKYIGRISSDGTFIQGTHRKPGLEAALIRAPRPSRRQEVVAPSYATTQHDRIGKYDKEILMALSMDGRLTIHDLSKVTGLKATATENQKSNMESKYGIKYIAEIDVSKLGYLTYIVMIRFENKKPGINEARRELENEPSIQLAMLTYGKYDIIMYIVLSLREEIKTQLFNIRNRIFTSYDLKLYVMPFYLDYSFVPLRDKFFDLLQERVWTRSIEKPRPKEGDLHRREYVALKELSQDGRKDFTDIDNMYELPLGSSRYAYQKLVEKGILKRITISMQNVHVNYVSAINVQKVNNEKFARYRKEFLQGIINDPDDSVMNKYALVGDIKMPEGVLLLAPVRNGRDIVAIDDELRRVEGVEVESMIITDVIVGSLCYRKFDNKQSSQYKILGDEYNAKQAPEIEFGP